MYGSLEAPLCFLVVSFGVAVRNTASQAPAPHAHSGTLCPPPHTWCLHPSSVLSGILFIRLTRDICNPLDSAPSIQAAGGARTHPPASGGRLGASGYRGVLLHARSKSWETHIWSTGRQVRPLHREWEGSGVVAGCIQGGSSRTCVEMLQTWQTLAPIVSL